MTNTTNEFFYCFWPEISRIRSANNVDYTYMSKIFDDDQGYMNLGIIEYKKL